MAEATRNPSLLTINAPRMMVIDPCPYPDWVYRRYAECGIDVEVRPGEHWAGRFDEGWIYNCLQHVEDPERVVCAMQANCRRIRVFEWVGIPAYDGHPHELDARLLEQWLGARGTEEYVNQDGAVGLAFFGVF